MRRTKTWNVAIAGFGSVGKEFVRLLNSKSAMLEERYGFKAKLCLVTSRSHGIALDPNGLNVDKLIAAGNAGGDIGPADTRPFKELLRQSGAEVLLEVTPTTKSGEPATEHIRSALSMGVHVSTTNKGPMALFYGELDALAKKHDAQLLFEGTVQSGTPLFAMIREGLAGCSFSGMQGILNASTNFILTTMEAGKNYKEACDDAYKAGLIEEDPTLDVEGFDAAFKVTILGKVLFGASFDFKDVDRTGITQVTPEMIREAMAQNTRIKLLAELRQEGGKVLGSVRPARLPLSNPLSQLDGTDNMVTLHTDTLGDVSIRGCGGGRRQTSQGLLADLLSITR